MKGSTNRHGVIARTQEKREGEDGRQSMYFQKRTAKGRVNKAETTAIVSAGSQEEKPKDVERPGKNHGSFPYPNASLQPNVKA